MLWLAPTVLLAPQAPAPAFVVDNRALVARDEVVRVSLPLPRGRYPALPRFAVGGQTVPAVPLMHWPDGTLQLVQLQPRVHLDPLQTRRMPVSIDPPAGAPAPVSDPPWNAPVDLPLHTELQDPWGAVYEARLAPDPSAGPGGVVRRSGRVCERRYRAVHARGARRFLGLVGLLTTFAGERRAELTLVLDNGAHDPDLCLGPVRFRGFDLVVDGPDLRVCPRFISENHLRPPTRAGVGWRQVLLPASDQWYLGDATAKAWRFDLFFDGEGVTAAMHEAARVAVDHPLRPVPALDWVRHTRAFGAHGAVAPAVGEAGLAVAELVQGWRLQEAFGPFGSFGDPADGNANGTPRNGASALHNVVRFASGPLLSCAEAMVLQHGLRPTPGAAVRLPEVTAPLRQRLSERAMRQPHGFVAMDYEHFSVDLLFDHFWLTGDPWAEMELRRMGRGLPRVLAALPFRTSRGEGWCMQAAVSIARATGSADLVTLVDARFRRDVWPEVGRLGASFVIAQPAHPDALDGTEAFDCPWQMSAFVHGAAAMHRQTGAPVYAEAVHRAARAMAGPGWVEGQGPKYLLSAVDPGRYTLPVGHGPLEGTGLMQLGAFVLAEAMAGEEADKTIFRRRAMTLAAPYVTTSRSRASLNPWLQIWLDAEAER